MSWGNTPRRRPAAAPWGRQLPRRPCGPLGINPMSFQQFSPQLVNKSVHISVGARAGPGRDPGGTRAGPGRDPSRTRTHRSAKLRSDGAPWGPGVQLRSSPHARTAHQGAARRSWGTERCVGLSHSGCNSARSLLTRVPAGSLPGPSRVPNRVKKKRFARGTRCLGASKRCSNDTEPWSVSLLHRAAAARAPHSLCPTRCCLFEGRKGKLEGVGGSAGGGGKLVATWWQLPY